MLAAAAALFAAGGASGGLPAASAWFATSAEIGGKFLSIPRFQRVPS